MSHYISMAKETIDFRFFGGASLTSHSPSSDIFTDTSLHFTFRGYTASHSRIPGKVVTVQEHDLKWSKFTRNPRLNTSRYPLYRKSDFFIGLTSSSDYVLSIAHWYCVDSQLHLSCHHCIGAAHARGPVPRVAIIEVAKTHAPGERTVN